VTTPEREDEVDRKPFPDSLCHRCAAPPQYIHTERSTFIRCPIFKRYPPQPVLACDAFTPAEGTEEETKPSPPAGRRG
jgi:hypothetical protein